MDIYLGNPFGAVVIESFDAEGAVVQRTVGKCEAQDLADHYMGNCDMWCYWCEQEFIEAMHLLQPASAEGTVI